MSCLARDNLPIQKKWQCKDSLNIAELNAATGMTLLPWYFLLPKGMGAAVQMVHVTTDDHSMEIYRSQLGQGRSLKLYFLCRIPPSVEAFSPYWIGGHVVGFVSFFTWLLYTRYRTCIPPVRITRGSTW
jgi:hypothetical protein